LDVIGYNDVPEPATLAPATLALLSTALLGLAALRQRRRI
jgi:hypothetical protein